MVVPNINWCKRFDINNNSKMNTIDRRDHCNVFMSILNEQYENQYNGL